MIVTSTEHGFDNSLNSQEVWIFACNNSLVLGQQQVLFRKQVTHMQLLSTKLPICPWGLGAKAVKERFGFFVSIKTQHPPPPQKATN